MRLKIGMTEKELINYFMQLVKSIEKENDIRFEKLTDIYDFLLSDKHKNKLNTELILPIKNKENIE